jgi:hypothetical protein
MDTPKQVKIAPEFFAKIKLDYANWRWALVREFLQNCFDAPGCKQVDVSIVEDAKSTVLTVSNDGAAMDEDTLFNKLLTLGGSGKRGPRLPRPPSDAAGQVVEQMVTKPKRVEPDALRSPGHREQLRPFDAPLDLGQLDTDAARTRYPRTLPAHTPTRSLRPWQATETIRFCRVAGF